MFGNGGMFMPPFPNCILQRTIFEIAKRFQKSSFAIFYRSDFPNLL